MSVRCIIKGVYVFPFSVSVGSVFFDFICLNSVHRDDQPYDSLLISPF